METHSMHTTSGIPVWFLGEVFKERSLDFEAFLKEFHISVLDLKDTTKRFDSFLISAIWEEARELLGHPFLHVEMEMRLPPGVFGALEFLFLTAPTVGQSIIALSNYADLWNTLLKISFERRPHEVEVHFSSSDPFYDLHDLVVEIVFCAILRRLRLQTISQFKLLRLNFSHAKTSRPVDYQNVFMLTPHFETDRNSIVFPNETWSEDLLSANESLHSHLTIYLQEMGKQFRGTHSDIIGRVRHYVFTNIGEREISIGEASKFLGLSPRSLQRALRETDTTFSAVIDKVKCNFALKWVREETMDLSEVGARIGFNDQSAFLKAYKRWTGMTPGEDRRRRQKES